MARRQTSELLRARPQTQRRPEHLTEQRARPPIVEMRKVTKVYPGGHVALERVSLRVDRGEFVFLVGPTGCGKTTLIKTLIRELQPTEGEVLIAGRDISSAPRQEGAPAASPDRHRLPGLQASAEPQRLRQRRLRAAGDRRLALGDPPQGARRPAPRRPRRQGQELPRPALRRRAAAPLGRARLRQPPAAAAGRRADREPRPQHLRSGSCRCSTGSTAPARPSWSSPTTARWWTRCAAA